MMSQMGSAAAPPAERRSASPPPATATLLIFMSAILTYFVFMLQKQHPRRKDCTKKGPFWTEHARALEDVLSRGPSHTGCHGLTQSVGIGAKNAPSQRQQAAATQGEGGIHGCPVLLPARRGHVVMP